MSTRDEVVAAAERSFARNDGELGLLFLNLWRRHGGAWLPNAFTTLDEAAEDAAQPNVLIYMGTVMVADRPRFLDLSAHGLAVAAEATQDATEEAAHERFLRRGAGRVVT